jgi:hypothetical protein
MKLVLFILLGIGAGLGVRSFVSKPDPVKPVEPAPAPAQPLEIQASSRPAPLPVAPLNPVFTEPLEVRGYAVRGRRVIVQLSDGSTLIETDKELTEISRNSVTISGKKYALKPAPTIRTEIGPQRGPASRGGSLDSPAGSEARLGGSGTQTVAAVSIPPSESR